MKQELAIPNSAAEVASHYAAQLCGQVLDEQDRRQAGTLDTPTTVANTVMITLQDRVDLGHTVLRYIASLA